MDIDLAAAGQRVRILVVSTGDVCRAPAAVRLLSHALRERPDAAGGIAPASAGTLAPIGCDLHPLTAEALRRRGVPPSEHLASELTTVAVAAADLVLAMERRHRLAVVELCPDAAERTFTLRELARGVRWLPPLDGLCGSGPSAPPTRLLARRDRWRPEHPADDDIPDPVTGDLAMHERAVEQVAAAIEVCSELLAAWAEARGSQQRDYVRAF